MLLRNSPELNYSNERETHCLDTTVLLNVFQKELSSSRELQVKQVPRAEAAAQHGEGKGKKYFMKHLLYAMLSPAVWQSVLFVQPSGAQLSVKFWELLTQRSQRFPRATFWVFVGCPGWLPHAEGAGLGSQGARLDSLALPLGDHGWSHLSTLPRFPHL